MDLCQICGAARDPLAVKCKFCGTAYTLTKLTGDVYIRALQKILINIDAQNTASHAAERKGLDRRSVLEKVLGEDDSTRSSRRTSADAKVTALQAFAMPSDLECLLQFLAFCHGNAQARAHDDLADAMKDAWYGKAKMAFTQLKMKAMANPDLLPYISDFEQVYGLRAKQPLSRNVKSGLILCALGALVFGALGYMAKLEHDGKTREIARLSGVVTKVQDSIAAGQYEVAESACAEIQWTCEPGKFAEMVKQYNQTRETLIAQIHAAKQNTKAK